MMVNIRCPNNVYQHTSSRYNKSRQSIRGNAEEASTSPWGSSIADGKKTLNGYLSVHLVTFSAIYFHFN